MELKDIWPENIKSQKLGPDYRENNKYKKNLRNRF